MTEKMNLTNNTSPNYLTIGNIEFKNGNYSEAIFYYKKALKKYPDLRKIIEGNIRIAQYKSPEVTIKSRSDPKNDSSNFSLNNIDELNVRPGRDAFMLRGLKPEAKNAVILDLDGFSDFSELSEIFSKFSEPHDLFVLGDFEKVIPYLGYMTVSITDTGLLDNKDGRAFLRLVKSNVLDEYDGVLWLTPKLVKGSESSVFFEYDSKIVNDLDCGIFSDFFISKKEINDHNGLLKTVRTVLPRIGLKYSGSELVVPTGGLIWIKPILLRGLSACLNVEDLNKDENYGAGRSKITSVLAVLSKEASLEIRNAEIVNKSLPIECKRNLKTIAFYLPQFHPIPENDLWWGKGFTEWSNVTRARQLFRGHYQPRIPTELGYYDLRLEETLIAQAELAREFGIHGFCYYYYWFDGKKLLNQPIELMAKSKRVDVGFCICWANENWSRNWDGQNRHVLLEQTYSLESNISLIREIIPMMKDERWIRHNGKPVMMVYRISIIPNWLETARAWRDECRKAGLGEIHLCAVRFGLETLHGAPQDHDLDSYVLFPPHESKRVDVRNEVLDLNKGFNGQIFDYKAVVDGDLESFKNGYQWPVHRGTMLGWDNTARRLNDARIFQGATPFAFRSWMKGILEQENRQNTNNESLVFINAWNEWAEGTYLEPDQRWGRSYLRAFSSAVQSVPGIHPSILPRGVAGQLRGPTVLDKIGNPWLDAKNLLSPQWNKGDRNHNTNWPTIMLCAHISGERLYGGERSLLDVLNALSELDVNIVMTLPSGNNRSYVREICSKSMGVYVFPYPQWRANRSNYAWLTNTFSDIIARHAVDIVHVNTIVLIEPLKAAARMKRVRVIHARELISLDGSLCKQIGLEVSEIVQKVYENSDWVIGNSQATVKLFWRNLKTLYVPNAVTLEDFDMANRFGETIKFGIVSSNIPKKGVADFVEVARRVYAFTKRAKFLIVGPENEQLKIWQDEVLQGVRPDNLIIEGYSDSPRTAMSKINVLLSLSYFAESFGRTIAEAMASRRPVIAYDWGAVSELVQHNKTGYLIPYRNIDGVVDAVVSICENNGLIESMGEAGRKYVSHNFSQNNLKLAMAKGYSSIVDHEIGSQEIRIANSRCVNTTGLPPARTSIIIPVFNAPEVVRDCIRSVLRHTNMDRDRVLVIDDGSTDENIENVLSEFKGASGITIIKNKSNIGYTKTINRGIREAGEDDIVLLNSDTVVTPKWLEGLRAAAYSSPKVGTVTAMSDNAGAFSFPKFNEHCPRPAHMSNDEYALLMTQATQYCEPPEVPTGSGFCLYIRRSMINECGLFDEEGFPRGYGEENDFCMRGLNMGWKNLISPWSFVYHIRTASFKGEKAALIKAGVDVVTRRYPDYSKLVKSAFSSREVQELRSAAAFNL